MEEIFVLDNSLKFAHFPSLDGSQLRFQPVNMTNHHIDPPWRTRGLYLRSLHSEPYIFGCLCGAELQLPILPIFNTCLVRGLDLTGCILRRTAPMRFGPGSWAEFHSSSLLKHSSKKLFPRNVVLAKFARCVHVKTEGTLNLKTLRGKETRQNFLPLLQDYHISGAPRSGDVFP